MHVGIFACVCVYASYYYQLRMCARVRINSARTHFYGQHVLVLGIAWHPRPSSPRTSDVRGIGHHKITATNKNYFCHFVE